MITWTEQDKANLRSMLQKGIGKKFMEYLKQDLPEIKVASVDHYSLLAAEKEGMMKQLRKIEGPMSNPQDNFGAMAAHVDMSKD